MAVNNTINSTLPLTGILTGNNTSAITASTVTQHGILLGGASNAVASLGVASNGQLAIGSAGANPVLGTLTAGNGISVTNGAGSITVAATGSVVGAFTDEATSFNALVANGYNITAGSVTATLPASPSQGDTIIFYVVTAAAFIIQANTGQVINLGNAASSSAGTLTSDGVIGDSITLTYRATGTSWWGRAVQGNWTAA